MQPPLFPLTIGCMYFLHPTLQALARRALTCSLLNVANGSIISRFTTCFVEVDLAPPNFDDPLATSDQLLLWFLGSCRCCFVPESCSSLTIPTWSSRQWWSLSLSPTLNVEARAFKLSKIWVGKAHRKSLKEPTSRSLPSSLLLCYCSHTFSHIRSMLLLGFKRRIMHRRNVSAHV